MWGVAAEEGARVRQTLILEATGNECPVMDKLTMGLHDSGTLVCVIWFLTAVLVSVLVYGAATQNTLSRFLIGQIEK
jgi:hypothetical protein